MKFESYEDLVAYIRKFDTWSPRMGGYDFGGMAHLLGACLDNLRKNALPAELESLADYLTPEQIGFLKQIATINGRHDGEARVWPKQGE